MLKEIDQNKNKPYINNFKTALSTNNIPVY